MDAARGLPNSADLWADVGFVQRQLGNWSAVDSAYRQAFRPDPRNVEVIKDLGGARFLNVRRYPDAVQAFDRVLVLAPDCHDAAILRARVFVLWKGELNTPHSALNRVPRDADLGARPASTLPCTARPMMAAVGLR